MQFYASFAHNLEQDEARYQMSQNLPWIGNLLLFLHLQRKMNTVEKGSVMDQFAPPTVPMLHSEAVPGLSRADADTELSREVSHTDC